MLSPRAIALQGLGFGAALIAVQGLLPITAPVPQIDTSVGGSHRHQSLGAPQWLRQAREEDEALLAMLQTLVWEM
jgi:hypothetical protein